MSVLETQAPRQPGVGLRGHKHHVTVPFSELATLMGAACQALDCGVSHVLGTIGYASSSSTYVKWEAAGEAPLRAKYALLGLLADLNIKAEQMMVRQFSDEELRLMLMLFAGGVVSPERRNEMIRRLAVELTR